jgi:ribonuclease BN (tRNA processing enzyme)
MEERSTGKIFVFLTDHENMDGMPWRLKRHVEGADLLIMDAQYSRKRYDDGMAGFGHGTPDYCVKIADMAQAKKLGFTHHDPGADDEAIEIILDEGKNALPAINPESSLEIFSCRDYQEIVL